MLILSYEDSNKILQMTLNIDKEEEIKQILRYDYQTRKSIDKEEETI